MKFSVKHISVFLFILISFTSCDFSKYRLVKTYDFETRFEKSKGKETATYKEVIAFYKDLDSKYNSIRLQVFDTTDAGEPLHLVIFNPDREFDWEYLKDEEKTIVLINNGIHPGESDGIDATMMMLRDMAQDSIPAPKNTIIAAIPIYNIGGALNRNTASRANQNGPEAYGFRGNARNYDLNRDFIKMDTKNARAFAKLFHTVNPDVFIDTHVSNGADYQYTLTHLLTQHNKMQGALGDYIHQEFLPELVDSLSKKNLDITPYVNVFNEKPEKGFEQFLDNPRYSSGYAALWNSLGLMIETHMLKPYQQRVDATYEMLLTAIDLVENSNGKIKKLREDNFRHFAEAEIYPLNYQVDKDSVSLLNFKGYEGSIKKSEVTGQNRLQYNSAQPFEKEIEYYNHFTANDSIKIPKAYLLPQGYWDIKEKLEANNIQLQRLEKDSIFMVEVYHIQDYQTVGSPYEGHYLHYNTEVKKSTDSIQFSEGDYLIPTHQAGIRYLLETLEPQAVDSFFNWNFFDAILQQKEHFSPYVFEDIAEKLLEDYPELKESFEQKKRNDYSFRSNSYAQLDWIYKRSKYYEKSHLRYPVFRVLH
ncbi:M14 family metallopeptidase [Mesonia sp. K7]|uniref:M14 family metallopeptidase n=1 Tax=Mesonia sp. K7 TaxID=2218606 RepID=UPI000DA7C63E|nr:M14 family metallopeptidase [Mesonia sp. K7]PZD78312.1 hypothetical protein DNG35_06325 [Mesonia sp. K7]